MMKVSTFRLIRCVRQRPWICYVAVLVLGFGSADARAVLPKDLFPEPVYVTLQASNAVESLPSGRLLERLESAHYDAISPDGSRLLVSSATQPEAYLVDTHTGKKLATFTIGPTPQGVAISPDGRWGLAVSAGDGTVSVIDIVEQKLVKSIKVGEVPHNAIFTANGRRAYVTLQGEDAVAVLDMQTLAKIGEIAVPGLKVPHNLDLSADGSILWIRGFFGKVAALDLTSRKVLAVIPVGPSHAGIDVIPGGRYVFTGGIAGSVVDAIDPKTFKVVREIPVGQGPHGVRASRDGRWVYVGVTGTNKVAVIDTRTLKVVEQIPMHGKFPFWVALAGNN